MTGCGVIRPGKYFGSSGCFLFLFLINAGTMHVPSKVPARNNRPKKHLVYEATDTLIKRQTRTRVYSYATNKMQKKQTGDASLADVRAFTSVWEATFQCGHKKTNIRCAPKGPKYTSYSCALFYPYARKHSPLDAFA